MDFNQSKRKMRSESFGKVFIKKFALLRRKGNLTDFVVSTDGQSFRVHKTLLAASSDYFHAMFKMTETQKTKVDLKGLSATSLRLILDFIYSGQMELDLDFENLIEMLEIASHLRVNTALGLCSEFMASLMDFNNAEELLDVADTYSLNRVITCYENKVLLHFEKFACSDMFLRLTGSQLARFVADDRLRVRSESILFESMVPWCVEQKQQDDIDRVLIGVRYGLMSEQKLMDLKNHWVVKKSSAARMCIQSALQYHLDSQVGHPTLSDQTQLRCTQTSLVIVHQDSLRPLEITAYNHKEGRFYQLISDLSISRDFRICSSGSFIYMCRVFDSGGGILMNSLLRFDLRHLSIIRLAASSQVRLDPAVVCCGKKLFAFGGLDDNPNMGVFNSVDSYDIEKNKWKNFVPGLPHATHSLAAVEHSGSVYVSGGVLATDMQPTTSMYKFDPRAKTWTQTASMFCPRRLHEMSILDDRIYVLGGIGYHSFDHGTQIPIEAYSMDTNQWTTLTGTLAGRSIGHYVTFNGEILSLGREHNKAYEEDIWLYNTISGEWRSFIKAPKRIKLASASCTKLNVNFNDEKIVKNVITDKR